MGLVCGRFRIDSGYLRPALRGCRVLLYGPPPRGMLRFEVVCDIANYPCTFGAWGQAGTPALPALLVFAAVSGIDGRVPAVHHTASFCPSSSLELAGLLWTVIGDFAGPY